MCSRLIAKFLQYTVLQILSLKSKPGNKRTMMKGYGSFSFRSLKFKILETECPQSGKQKVQKNCPIAHLYLQITNKQNNQPIFDLYIDRHSIYFVDPVSWRCRCRFSVIKSKMTSDRSLKICQTRGQSVQPKRLHKRTPASSPYVGITNYTIDALILLLDLPIYRNNELCIVLVQLFKTASDATV